VAPDNGRAITGVEWGELYHGVVVIVNEIACDFVVLARQRFIAKTKLHLIDQTSVVVQSVIAP
jgi:hypothetical protein